MLSAPHHLAPDVLTRISQPSKVDYVSGRTALGKGANALEIIPLRTVTGERQMVVYFPDTKILYSTDLFQRDRSGEFFLPQTLSEAADVVDREHLDVNLDIGMHLDPTAVERNSTGKSGKPRLRFAFDEVGLLLGTVWCGECANGFE
jgi:hypothetical protein